MRKRDQLIIGLTEQLLAAREQNGALRERLRWFEAAMPDMPPLAAPLRLAGSPAYGRQAPRRSSSPAVARMP